MTAEVMTATNTVGTAMMATFVLLVPESKK